MKYFYLAVLSFLLMHGTTQAQSATQTQVKKTGKEIGQTGKTVGKEIGKTGKSVGKSFKKPAKQVGREAQRTGKEVGRETKKIVQ